MFATPVRRTHLHTRCPQHLSKYIHTLRKKCTCTRVCAPIQRCRSYCELILSLARSSYRLSFVAAVAAAVSHNIIRSSALVQVSSSLSMGRTRSVTTYLTHHIDLFPPFFWRGLTQNPRNGNRNFKQLFLCFTQSHTCQCNHPFSFTISTTLASSCPQQFISIILPFVAPLSPSLHPRHSQPSCT